MGLWCKYARVVIEMRKYFGYARMNNGDCDKDCDGDTKGHERSRKVGVTCG